MAERVDRTRHKIEAQGLTRYSTEVQHTAPGASKLAPVPNHEAETAYLSRVPSR